MTDTITLGGRRFEVRPLKLGQLRHLLDALDEMTGKSGGALIEAAAKVVTAGLAPAQPDLDLDAVLDIEASLDQLNAAVAAVLRIAGLTPRENATGEARPVASPGDVPGEQLSAVYGALATGCGYPYDVIDGMTLAEAEEIFTCWEDNPPAHLMLQTIARLLGWMPRGTPAGAPPIEEIAAAAPPGLTVARGGDLGMPAPTDLDTLRAKNRAQAVEIARRNQSAVD